MLSTFSIVSIKYFENDQQFYLTSKSFIRNCHMMQVTTFSSPAAKVPKTFKIVSSTSRRYRTIMRSSPLLSSGKKQYFDTKSLISTYRIRTTLQRKRTILLINFGLVIRSINLKYCPVSNIRPKYQAKSGSTRMCIWSHRLVVLKLDIFLLRRLSSQTYVIQFWESTSIIQLIPPNSLCTSTMRRKSKSSATPSGRSFGYRTQKLPPSCHAVRSRIRKS